MEKRADNTFVGGLNTDRHPLASSKEELIEAFNIDLGAVGQGYQLILQKREGNSELLIYNPNTQLFESAGLPEGFIPLAVREFNNVAYIISVNPDTGYGELGTFPSPDYDSFSYDTGQEIPLAATILPGTYDGTGDPPEFGYDLELEVGTGEIEFVSATLPPNQDLLKSGAAIYQIGYTPDTYTLTLNDLTGNLKLQYYTNGDLIFKDYTVPITLNNVGDYIFFQAVVLDPWSIAPARTYGIPPYDVLEPDVVQSGSVDITTATGQPLQSVTFRYFARTIAQVRRNLAVPPIEAWGTTSDWTFLGTDGPGDIKFFDYRQNNFGVAVSAVNTVDFPYGPLPAWLHVDPMINMEGEAMVKISCDTNTSVAPNPTPPQRSHTVRIFLSDPDPYDPETNCDIEITQDGATV